MNISSQIDQLIQKLNSLKPMLSDDKSKAQEKFNDILRTSLHDAEGSESDKVMGSSPSPNKRAEIPSWVDSDYGYSAANPRKPNMREMMEALTGKTVEELYADASSNWQEVSELASEILHGVTGSKEDKRDWSYIMTSDDILRAAREQTGKALEPKVDVISKYDVNNVLKEQVAVIKDKNGNVLRLLPANVTSAEEILRNYGATHESIPTNFETLIEPGFFNNNFLSALKNFDRESEKIQEVAMQTTTEAISKKLVADIPLQEFLKL